MLCLHSTSVFVVVIVTIILSGDFVFRSESCVAYQDPPGQEPAPGDPFEISLKLGDLDFPNSGSSAAQSYFKEGLLLLHNFWYDLATQYFQKAIQIDPNFAMAYWGQAISQNQQLWLTENVTLSASIMSQIPANAPMSERERNYIKAANLLFDQSLSFDERYFSYNSQMKALFEMYSDDLDAAAFYSLSTMSLVSWGLISFDDWTENYFEKTLSILQSVADRNAEHPGAPHYIIHACDDPVNPSYALEACQNYPIIAQDTSHGQHMPSHIYYRLGMWNDSLLADNASFNASVWYADLIGQSASCGYDWHSWRWLIFTQLQLGQWNNSYSGVEVVKNLNDSYLFFQYTDALEAASYIIETQRWDQCEKIVPPFIECPSCGDTRDSSSYFHWTHLGNSAILTANGLAALALQNIDLAEQMIQTGQYWESELISTEPYYAGLYGIAWREIQSGLYLFDDHHEQADEPLIGNEKNDDHDQEIRQLMEEAVEIEMNSGVPHDGPPVPIQPSAEFYGDLLLQLGDYTSALSYFESSLKDIPGRARSILGKARAQYLTGDIDGAADTYQTLLYQYYTADQDIPPYIEAQEFVDNGSTFRS